MSHGATRAERGYNMWKGIFPPGVPETLAASNGNTNWMGHKFKMKTYVSEIEMKDDKYFVWCKSQKWHLRRRVYKLEVVVRHRHWLAQSCTCPDRIIRNVMCKHMHCVNLSDLVLRTLSTRRQLRLRFV